MQVIKIATDLTDHSACPDWPRFNPSDCILIQNQIRVGRMPMGTKSGNSTVMFLAPLPGSKKTIVLELTMANFELLAAAMRGAEERSKGN